MIQRIVISFVISFVLKQLEKFQDAIDWDKVRVDAEVRVRALVPGTWFDVEAVGLVDRVLLALKDVLGAGDELKKILQLLAKKDWPAAAEVLKGILLDAFKALGEEASADHAAVQTMEFVA